MLEMNEKIPLPPPRVKSGLFANGEHWGILSALHPVIALFLFWGSLTTVKHAHHLGGK